MPYPKAIKTPEVRAAWIARHHATLQAFDQLVDSGTPRYKAARALGLDPTSVEAMRRSVEQLEENPEFVGAAGHSYIDLGLSLLSCLRKPGETLTTHDIAAWCNCSRAAIQRIEARALRKVRRRLVEASNDQELADELRGLLERTGGG